MRLPATFGEFASRKIERCSESDCIAPATLSLQIKVWAKGYDKAKSTPLLMESSIYRCAAHTWAPTAGDFFTEEGKARIVSALEAVGKAAPDFDTAEFSWVPIAGALGLFSKVKGDQ